MSYRNTKNAVVDRTSAKAWVLLSAAAFLFACSQEQPQAKRPAASASATAVVERAAVPPKQATAAQKASQAARKPVAAIKPQAKAPPKPVKKKPVIPKTLVKWFEGTYEEAVAHATKLDRPMMIDCVADWCLPCKEMDRYTFNDQLVADYLNANFVSFRLDATGNPLDTLMHLENYEVRNYPTLLFTDKFGKEISRFNGFRSPEQVRFDSRQARTQPEETRRARALYAKAPKPVAKEASTGGVVVTPTRHASEPILGANERIVKKGREIPIPVVPDCEPFSMRVGGKEITNLKFGLAAQHKSYEQIHVHHFNQEVACKDYTALARKQKDDEQYASVVIFTRKSLAKQITIIVDGHSEYTRVDAAPLYREPTVPGELVSICVPKMKFVAQKAIGEHTGKTVEISGLFQGRYCGRIDGG